MARACGRTPRTSCGGPAHGCARRGPPHRSLSAPRGTVAMERAERVVDRVEALRRLVGATEAYLPASRLAPARALVARAGERLALSRSHTVAALAGATGSGKSTIFNT